MPGGDWAALDLREEGYDRHAIPSGLVVEGDVPVAAQVYAVPVLSMQVQDDPAPILLSYLDVVVQGYLREFGEAGARDFFATTDGWDTVIQLGMGQAGDVNRWYWAEDYPWSGRERWQLDLDLPQGGEAFEYAVVYRHGVVNGARTYEFWDNNFGANYVVPRVVVP